MAIEMESTDDKSDQPGFEAKKEKPLLVQPKLKIKFTTKSNRETAFNNSQEVDHSGSDGGEGPVKTLGVQMNGNDAVYGEKKLTCTVCKKRLPTPKSLCGHMRCHSEKVNSIRPMTTTTSPDGRFTPLFLPRLPAGCKRRRTCGDSGGGGAADVKVLSSMMDVEAVYGLMLLATGDEFYRNVPLIEQDKEIRISEKKEAGSASSTIKKPRICGHKEEESKLEMVRKRKNETNQQTMIRNTGQEQVVVIEGGVSLDESAKEMSLACGVMMIGRGGGIHVCKRCKKAFPSGQALGGHMSLHRKAPVQDDALALSLSTPAAGFVVETQAQAQGGEEQVARKKVFMCLDLNEIPTEDFEEGGY